MPEKNQRMICDWMSDSLMLQGEAGGGELEFLIRKMDELYYITFLLFCKSIIHSLLRNQYYDDVGRLAFG